MSDTVQSFEFILKNGYPKRCLTLYSGTKTVDIPRCTPQDVISSVSTQLNAMQVADSLPTNRKYKSKFLSSLNRSKFLSDNKLPNNEQIRKKSTKFDTQCVTDTQLIHIIEDAEIIDAHHGITQEFDTSFTNTDTDRHAEKIDLVHKNKIIDNFQLNIGHSENKTLSVHNEGKHNDKINIKNSHSVPKFLRRNINYENTSEIDKAPVSHIDPCEITQNVEIQIHQILNEKPKNSNTKETCYQFLSQCSSNRDNNKASESVVNDNAAKVNCDGNAIENSDTVAVATNNCIKDTGNHENNNITDAVLKMDSDENIQYSQILCSNFHGKKLNVDQENNCNLKSIIQGEKNIQTTKDKTIVNQSVEVKHDTDRPFSPILCKNCFTSNSNLSSPLVFNLDKFEYFESIVIPVIQSNDFETAKHVINSQILSKELHLKMNDDIELRKRDITRPTVNKIANSNFVMSNTDTTLIQVDNTKYLNAELNRKPKKNISTDLLKDDILFSSDEEDYVANDVQSLPFTCSLESSFYDQLGVQEKTMFVGFQTASNRSIQVCADSFAIAESLLNDITDNTVTVTELVENSEQQKLHWDKNTTTLLGEKKNNDSSINIVPKLQRTLMMPQTINKEIGNSSNIAKQDVVMSDDFRLGKKYVLDKNVDGSRYKQKNMLSEPNELQNVNHIDGVLEGIDEDIVQEFENIEMSLEDDDKKEKIKTVTKMTKDNDSSLINELNHDRDFTAAPSNKDIQIEKQTILLHAPVPTKSILKNIASVGLCKNLFQPSTSKDFIGFRTANNRDIKIGAKAWIKTKNIFNDLNSTKLPNETNIERPRTDLIEENQSDRGKAFADSRKMFQYFDDKNKSLKAKPLYPEEIYQNDDMYIQHTEILNGESAEITSKCKGFHTASRKTVWVSKSALEKSKSLFQDIGNKDKELFPFNENNDIFKQNNTKDSKSLDFISSYNKLETVPISPEFSGFKTGSKQPVIVSIEALEKSQKIFEDIQLSLDKQISVDVAAKTGFSGFQTARKKQIKVSAKALASSRNFFKDIDSENKSVKVKPVYPEEIYEYNNMHIEHTETLNKGSTKIAPKFKGFHTASRKPVSVWTPGLEKNEELFQNVDDKGKELLACNENNNILKQNFTDDSKSLDFVKDNSELETVPISQEFKGFLTGNQQLVTVSFKSLDKSKKIFEDIQLSLDKQSTGDVYVKNGLSGFQTARNKQIKVSAKALANSRKLFQDIDSFDDKNKSVKVKPLYPEEIYQYDDMHIRDTETLNKERMEITPKFKGFHTASRKPVSVSKSALEKSEKLFQDIDDNNKIDCRFQNGNENIEFENAKIANIFQELDTRTEDLSFKEKSKHMFSEMDHEINISLNKNGPSIVHESNIDNLIDTQISNQFHEALYTDDFRDATLKSKRSGSPILSCPRAKTRKKFEVPYNLNYIPKSIPSPLNATKRENNIIYREDYKKTKRYTLKYLKDTTKDLIAAIDPYLFNFNYDTLLQFEFNKNRNNLSCGNMRIDLLKEYFLDTVDAKLVPKAWLDNHIRLILWKLISYEVKFKHVVCTAKNVLEQLKYRYDKELYNAERPALRKILEKDDVPSKTIVLCVVQIYVDGEKVSRVIDTNSNIELLVTDGWYCICCSIDRMLSELVCRNKITIGSKFVTSGAELMSCEHGISPWEDTSAVRLKIFGNSTRRARWDARLGYYAKGTIVSDLASVKVFGGKVSKLRLFVARVYPALYVEKFEDGSTVTRSERLENLHQIKTETERQAFMEKLGEEVEKEFCDQDSEDSEHLSDSLKRTCMDSGSQIAKMMKTCKDPAEFSAHLTNSQVRRLEDHTRKKRDKLLDNIQTRLRKRIEEAGVGFNRNVICLLKIRIAGVRVKDDKVEVTKGMMSIWKPNDVVREMITEGVWIDVMNVVPTAIRYGDIQISAGRQSIFSQCQFQLAKKFKPYTNLLHRQCYPIKELVQIPAISTDYNEIDTVGLVIQIDPPSDSFDSTKQQFQNVYLSDADCNIICVNFWGGIKKYGFQNIFDIGLVVSSVNLQKRAGNTRKNIPHYRVTEFSYFTLSPRNEDARKILDDLNKTLSSIDRRKFCNDCVVLKNNYSLMKQNNENVSPYRCTENNSDVNLSRNKMLMDSSRVNSTKQNNFNLTGLDFESTFKQDAQLSEEALKRKREINEKIAKLKMYGEPPPLYPMNITNRSRNASSMYKSPILSNNNKDSCAGIPVDTSKNVNVKSDNYINVAKVKNTSRNCSEIDGEITDSPKLNRTYLKSINPVKLNFKYNNDNNNYFVEDFDSSSPLSLDSVL